MSRWIATFFVAALLAGCQKDVPPADSPAPESKPVAPETETPSKPTDEKPATSESKPAASAEPVAMSEPAEIPAVLPLDEAAVGWIALFDGYSLFGWEPEFESNWKIVDGVLTSEGSSPPSILVTTVPWTDFELQLEYKLEQKGNSGVFLRAAPKPSDPSKDCYELNLCDSHETFKTGSIVTRSQPITEVNGDGQWHRLRVLCEGNWIQAWLDDVHMTDFRDESDAPLLSGRIGLQQNGGTIEFKNVKLKPLSTRPLFDGKTLNGWRVVPGSKAEFEVADGTIHATNGPGFLETEQTFGDFVLQADFFSNGDGLNSGIFFRAMTGTAETPSHGYEFQLHSGIKNDDPTQPVDSGTGAIFRRVQARRVMSRDKDWNTVTLNASGNRFASWVNGLQVVDWQDDRAPDENPRKGQRLEAGHFSLQGHDPTTDLNFRNLQVSEHAR